MFMKTYYAVLIFCLLAWVNPQATAKPKPNVIVILADDLGFSDIGCYGGEIATPNIDRLAANGLRFNQFYNSAKCEPTRASLISGQYWQDCGLGIKKGITMGQAMQSAGYSTFAVGKWHLHGNPVDRGFDRYFGHLSGASDFFKGSGTHRLDDKPFKPEKDGKFYTTDANVDYAIQFIETSKKQDPEKPFFMYLAFNAPHGPIQAWPEDIAKYRGKYKVGWDKLREQRYQRLVDLGIINKEWALPPRPDTIPAWDDLTDEEKDFEDLRMAIYAAMVDRMDQAIGRVLAKVKDLGEEENTLVMFMSDNGGSPYDRGRRGTLPDPGASWEYGLGWASLSNTPFRNYKRNMFNGGSCTPFVVSWPAVIMEHGAITDQQAHIIDIMATLMDASDSEWPKESAGEPLAPLPGKSLLPIFSGKTRTPHEALYFQLMDHKAIVAGDWKLVSDWGQPWQLFSLADDRTETNDLSKVHPERMKQLEDKWNRWWETKNPKMFNSAGKEPTYRRLNDRSENPNR